VGMRHVPVRLRSKLPVSTVPSALLSDRTVMVTSAVGSVSITTMNSAAPPFSVVSKQEVKIAQSQR
jgi:hypothetical protein